MTVAGRVGVFSAPCGWFCGVTLVCCVVAHAFFYSARPHGRAVISAFASQRARAWGFTAVVARLRTQGGVNHRVAVDRVSGHFGPLAFGVRAGNVGSVHRHTVCSCCHTLVALATLPTLAVPPHVGVKVRFAAFCRMHAHMAGDTSKRHGLLRINGNTRS